MAKIFTHEQVDQTIKDYLSKLKGKIKIDKVILFGSYAKGTATELSDVDLLIISKTCLQMNQNVKMVFIWITWLVILILAWK